MVFVNDIKKKYRKLTVLNGISFTVSPGDCIAILGENGCGKSSLIRAILHQVNGTPTNFSTSGELTIASNLKISYINQDTSHLKGTLAEYAD